jgi:branched-subunit amino acid aminotransferase/4-amino-4-deoxychorismate lyase
MNVQSPWFRMADSLVYLNGRFLPQAEARIAIDDIGFVMGVTATDRCRTFRHRLFRLEDHLVRFRRSCRLAGIPQPIDDEDLHRGALELVAANVGLLPAEQDLVLVMCATPGPIVHSAAGATNRLPTLLIHTVALPCQRDAPLFDEGARLATPSIRQIPSSTIDTHIKHRSRLHWWLAEQEVQCTDPGASALLLNEHGHVTETASSNILIVKDGEVISPPAETILGGISLLTVREYCHQLGLPFRERFISVEDCLRADEAILTCTSFCLAGVSRINGQALPWPGVVTARLLDHWSEAVGVDIRRQILTNR